MRIEAWRRHSQSLRRLAFYLWSMCALSHATTAMAAAQPGPVTPLELKLPISRRVAGAEMHFYRVHLRAGEFMRVRVDQKGVDISVTVHGDDGHLIAVINSPNEKEGPEVLSFIAERTAMYFVRVKPVTQGGTQDGEYTLVLEDVRAATPRDHQQVQAEREFMAVREDVVKRAQDLQPVIEAYERVLAKYRGAADKHLLGVVEKRIAGLKAMKTSAEAALAAGAEMAKQEAEDEAIRLAASERRRRKDMSNANFPQLVVPTGHSSGISSTAFSPDGRVLATGSADNTAKLWDIETGQELRTLQGHERLVYWVAFSPDGRTLATGSADHTAKLWDVASGKLLRTLTGHTHVVFAVAFSPDGRSIATGSLDGTAKIWELETGRELHTLKGHPEAVFTLTFSPDARILATGSTDKTIKLWDPRTGQELSTLSGHTAVIYSLAFSSDGRLLASGSGDNAAKLWDVGTGRLQNTLSGHTDFIRSVALSPDGRLLATGSADKTVKFWDARSGELLRTLPEFDYTVVSAIFSPSENILATGSGAGSVKLWDVSNGRELRVLSSPPDLLQLAAFSPDGQVLASAGTAKTIQIWDNISGRLLQALTGHVDVINSLGFSPDSRLLASVSNDKTVKVWDVNAGRVLCTFKGHSATIDEVAFSPDGRTVASGGEDKTVRLWEPETCKAIHALKGHTAAITSLAFSRDGLTLASGARDKAVKLWDVRAGRELRTLSGHSLFVVSLAFSSDGRTLASGSSDPETRYKGRWKGDSSIKLWDVATGRELSTLARYSDFVYHVALSPDGRVLASRNPYSLTKVWDVGTGQEVKWDQFPGWYGRALQDVLTTPSGKLIRADTEGTSIILREVDNEDEFARLVVLEGENWFVVTPEGYFDGTNRSWQGLRWRFNNNTFDTGALETYFGDFFYPNLLQEVFSGNTPRPPDGRELEQIDRRRPTVEIAAVNSWQRSQIISPAASQTAADKRMATVVVEVSDNVEKKRRPGHPETGGAQDVRLFRNGSLVKVWHGDVLGSGKTHGCEPARPKSLHGVRRVRCQIVVPLVAGDNTFTAYAFNSSNVKSSDDAVTIRGADSLSRVGTLYVLAIGVGRHQNPQYDLNYAVADARVFGSEISRTQEQVKRYGRVAVTLLLDDQALKANILSSLKKLAETVQPEDGLLVYFSGHGTVDGNRFYLIPHDLGYRGSREGLNAAALRELLTRSISDRELEVAFEKIDAGQILMVIDACNSGQALDAEEKRRGPMNSKGLAQLAYEKGMYVLTASQSVELAYESKTLKHSYLTYALVEEGLRSKVKETDANGDGQVWLREWFAYAEKRVPLMWGERTGQTVAARTKMFDLMEVTGRGRVQTPRVFYRREPDTQPWVVALSR